MGKRAKGSGRSSKYHAMVGQIVNGQHVVALERSKSGNWLAVTRCACGKERPVEPKALVAGRSTCCKYCALAAQSGPRNRTWKGGKYVSRTMFSKFKRAAERRGIPWELEIADIDALYEAQGGRCALSGEVLRFDHGHDAHQQNGNASLDRKNARLGYAINNIQLTTKTINVCKQVLTNNEFISMCLAVAGHQEVTG